MRGKRFKAAVQHVFDIKGMAKLEDKTWKEVAWWVDMHEEDSETEWDRATQQAKHQAARRRHHKGGTRTHQVTPEQYQADRARFSQLLNLHLEPLTYHHPQSQSPPNMGGSQQAGSSTDPPPPQPQADTQQEATQATAQRHAQRSSPPGGDPRRRRASGSDAVKEDIW